MPARLVALDEGCDIPLDQTMVVVGRHPQCDARLDSLRISRHHCCMTQDKGEVVVRDLGSTNGIRINGQRVENGRLRPGDELSIAHIRYRFDNDNTEDHVSTMADVEHQVLDLYNDSRSSEAMVDSDGPARLVQPDGVIHPPDLNNLDEENPLAQAVRKMLPAGVADHCRIQVIVHMNQRDADAPEKVDACRPNSSP